MKTHSRYLVPIGILFYLLLCLVPSSNAQKAGQPFPFQIGLSWPAQSAGSASFGGFEVTGLQYFSVDWIVAGTVSACTVTLDGASSIGGAYSTGSIVSSQNCASTGTFSTSTPTQNVQAQLTYNITGSGSVTFVVRGFALNPATAGCALAALHFPADRDRFWLSKGMPLLWEVNPLHLSATGGN